MGTDSTNWQSATERSTELDAVFNALADAKRRAVLEVLQERQRVGLEELATALTEDERSVSRVKIELHHSHLPRLADAGMINYGPDHVCELDTNSMPLRVMETAKRVSSDNE